MALQHFCRFSDDKGIDYPVLGGGSARSYTHTFGTGKFANAIYCPWDTSQNIEFGASPYYFGKEVTVEWWMKLNNWGWAGNTRTGSYPPWINNNLFGRAHNYGYNCQPDFWINNGTSLDIGYNGHGIYLTTTNAYIPADTWTHIAWTKRDVDYTTRLYINGTQVATQNNGQTINGLYMGYFSPGGPIDYGAYGAYLWVCNAKIYNHAKTDFSDRFNERAGMNDTMICI